MSDQPHAIIIGAGFTGCALAHDLSQRGFNVTVVERGAIASGTSGRTHGLLHSGARYCVNDPEAAVECIRENIILRNIAHQCIEFNGGLIIALTEEDLEYEPLFVAGAEKSGIPIERLTPQQALKLEPNINPNHRIAYTIPDGTFDPLRLALAFAATAVNRGADFKPYHEVKGILMDGRARVVGVSVRNHTTGAEEHIHADMVINATGAWAGKVAELVGIHVPVIPTPGIMVAYDQRLVNRPINRLCPPADGDIVLPQRRMVVVGTTSFTVEDADYIPIVPEQVKQMFQQACDLVPGVSRTNQRGVYMSARPLIGSTAQGRSLSRTFKCYDHQDSEGIAGLVTITGGKATTCRAMAETTADIVCRKLGIQEACQTHEIKLASYRDYFKNGALA